MERLLISIAIILFGGGSIAFFVLRYFYKKSILYSIGLFIISFALLISVISRIGQDYKSFLTYIFAIRLPNTPLFFKHTSCCVLGFVI